VFDAMKSMTVCGITACVVLSFVAPAMRAHGGTYALPPGTTGIPGQPEGFFCGGTRRPQGGRRATRAVPSPTALDWRVWWELNDERFFRLKVERRRGTESRATPHRASAVRALNTGLSDRWWDARTASVLALAKIDGASGVDVVARLKEALTDERMEVRESACLGLGLTAAPESVPLLLSIYNNEPAARALHLKKDVSNRQRTFAALAVGLAGLRLPLADDADVVESLLKSVRTRVWSASRDLKTGPATALAVMGATSAVPELLKVALDEESEDDVRAHVVSALGKLGDSRAIPDLVAHGLSDRKDVVRRSAAIALGRLVSADDRKSVLKVLDSALHSPDRATRNFAIIALGEIGGPDARDALADFVRYGEGHDKTFGAIACGVYASKRSDAPAIFGELVDGAFRAARAHGERAAFAVALGLLDRRESLPALIEALKGPDSPTLKGYLCLAIGLMSGETSDAATKLIRAQAAQTGDFETVRHALLALGLCGDRQSVSALCDVIGASSDNLSQLGGAARAIGMIGDDAAIPQLAAMLENADGSFKDNARAFAAVSLGRLSDRDAYPAVRRLWDDLNYLSFTEALAELVLIY
jgi:HEAT repeat protein